MNIEIAGGTTDPLAIALEELRAKKIDMIIRRKLPNGKHEDVHVVRYLLDSLYSLLSSRCQRDLVGQSQRWSIKSHLLFYKSCQELDDAAVERL